MASKAELDEQEDPARQASNANVSILLAFEPIKQITTVDILQYPYCSFLIAAFHFGAALCETHVCLSSTVAYAPQPSNKSGKATSTATVSFSFTRTSP